MKNLFLASILCLTTSYTYALTNPNPAKAIIEAVEAFVKSADTQNTTKMEKVLHNDFRVLGNRLFGSKTLSVTNKKDYIAMLAAKKIGGDDRTVIINSIDIQGANAYVNATFNGKKLTFNTYLLLVEDKDGSWKVLSDMPVISKIEQ